MSVQIVVAAALVASAAPLAWWAVGGQTRGAVVRQHLAVGGVADLRSAALASPASERLLAPLLAKLARAGRRVSPAGALDKLDQRLAAAGVQGTWTVERVLAAKLLLAAFGGLVGLLVVASRPGGLTILLAVAATGAAWFTPDVLVIGRADDRRKRIEQQLPDVIDQVTIAVEAGLGFESALARVTANVRGELAGELHRALQDIQLGVSRGDALQDLAQRTGVADLRHFVVSLRQAERYGLPIANVLRIQSSELREKRRQRAEEHAMKVPVKVLFPLVFCILPTLFIVILGPAVIRIADSGLG